MPDVSDLERREVCAPTGLLVLADRDEHLREHRIAELQPFQQLGTVEIPRCE